MKDINGKHTFEQLKNRAYLGVILTLAAGLTALGLAWALIFLLRSYY